MSTEVDAWFATDRPQKNVLDALRQLALDLGLDEELKWRQPCYTVSGRNVAIISLRKEGCVIAVFRGEYLDDPQGLLRSAGPNTRGSRLLLFTSLDDVAEQRTAVQALLTQAIELGRAGPAPKRPSPIEPIPDELTLCFEADPELKDAFEALTPGRRRGYLLHFNAARQSATRTRRIQEDRFRIMAGKGRLDCVCGRSARMPRCDGSHRNP